MTPTARTLDYLRRAGYLADVVERFLPAVNRKRDCFGVGDVLAVHPAGRAVLLVQATTGDHVADRLRRIQARPETPGLLKAGVGVEVWGWSLRAGRWTVRRVAVRVEDLAAVELTPRPLPRRQRKGQRQRGLFDPDRLR
jgi:hypothetical protein